MYIRSLALFLLITTGIYAAAIVLTQLMFQFYHVPVFNEAHFLDTIKIFASGLTMENLANYNETSGPLPFLIYGIWGRIFSFDIPTLRYLSLLMGFATLSLVHLFLWSTLYNKKHALIAALFIAVNPYMVTLSVLIYTDIVAMAFLFLAAIAVVHEKPWLFAFAMACALLCRQFFVFFPLAVGMTAILKLVLKRDTSALSMLGASIFSILPIGIIMLTVWQGICPNNATREAWVNGMLGFHPEFLTLYIAMLTVYLFPYLVYKYKSLYPLWAIGFATGLSFIYWFFPAGPSISGLQYGFVFTGCFHRLLSLVSTSAGFYHTVLFACFFLGIPLVLAHMKELGRSLYQKAFNVHFVMDLSLILFLVLNAFFYLAFEKFLLPILPMVLARLLSLEPRP